MRNFTIKINGQKIDYESAKIESKKIGESSPLCFTSYENTLKISLMDKLDDSLTSPDKMLSTVIYYEDSSTLSFDCFLSFYQESPSLYAEFCTAGTLEYIHA